MLDSRNSTFRRRGGGVSLSGRRDELVVHVDAEHGLRRGGDPPDEPAVSAADVEHAQAFEVDHSRQRLELAALRVDRDRHRGIVVLYLAE